MPIVDRGEASDLDQAIQHLLDALTLPEAVNRLRQLFADRLDFQQAAGSLPIQLDGASVTASRIAQQDGVHVIALAFQRPRRVHLSDVRNALKQLRQVIAGEVLLVAADRDRSQWHFIYPSTHGGREVLRRMVVERGQPRRTVVEQLAGVYWDWKRTGDLRGAFERAYDVEAVTKRFFQKYREVFERVMELVSGLPDQEERKLFCQTLFNRLMFLYFLLGMMQRGMTWFQLGSERNWKINPVNSIPNTCWQ